MGFTAEYGIEFSYDGEQFPLFVRIASKKGESLEYYPMPDGPVLHCKSCRSAADFGNICRRFGGADVEPDGYCAWGTRK